MKDKEITFDELTEVDECVIDFDKMRKALDSFNRKYPNGIILKGTQVGNSTIIDKNKVQKSIDINSLSIHNNIWNWQIDIITDSIKFYSSTYVERK